MSGMTAFTADDRHAADIEQPKACNRATLEFLDRT
jgi:hypothetical protein